MAALSTARKGKEMEMSKQGLAKDSQGFRKESPKCALCKHFKSEKITISESWRKGWEEEKNVRCGIGAFKIGRSNGCEKFEWKSNKIHT